LVTEVERAGQDHPGTQVTDGHAKFEPARQQALTLLDNKACKSAKPSVAEPTHLEIGGIDALVKDCAAGKAIALAPLDRASARGHNPDDSRPTALPVSDTAPRTRARGRGFDAPIKPRPEQEGDSTSPHNEPPLAPTREHLLALAQEKYKNDPTALANFEHDMTDFEKRMMAQSPVEVQRTYTQLNRILEGPSSVVSDEDRIKLAQQVMHEAAHPDICISQGYSNTCVAASLESRAYTETPSGAAKVVADIALTGSFRTTDGRTITPSSGVSHPYANDGLDTPGRNFASQIFQVATMNKYIDMLNQAQTPPGKFRYALTPSTTAGIPFEEHLYDDSTKPPRDIYMGGLPDNANLQAELYRQMTGKSGADIYIQGSSFQSLADFQKRLTAAQQSHTFPLVASVYPSDKPFSTELEEWKNSAQGKQWQKDHPDVDMVSAWSHHAITIQSYDPATGKITYLDPNLSHELRTSNAQEIASAMGITLWPDVQDQYFEYQKTFPEDARYLPDSDYSYLAQLPPAKRQEIFDKMCQMKNFSADEFTDAQFLALGIRKPPSAS